MFGDKDTDGFYRAEIRDRPGLIPCNMVSEIQTEDDEMMDQLLKQGFLPLNTPVEKLGSAAPGLPLSLFSFLCYSFALYFAVECLYPFSSLLSLTFFFYTDVFC